METGDIYSENEEKVYDSTAPNTSRWFSRFMLGAKWRMGVMRRQYEALMVDQRLLIVGIDE